MTQIWDKLSLFWIMKIRDNMLGVAREIVASKLRATIFL